MSSYVLVAVCRKCIYKKLTIEEMECCPICKIDLGCVPLEKLRPDHNLQDVRAKLFPYKWRNGGTPEVVHSTSSPVKRKEISLSSLVVNTPKIPAQGGFTGRRSKNARKAAKGSSFLIEKPMKKQECLPESHPHRTSSPETQRKFSKKIRQNFSAVNPLTHSPPDRGVQDDTADPSEPLYSTSGKEAKFSPSGFGMKNSRDPSTKESQKPKKLQKVRQKKSGSGDFDMLPQAVLDATSFKSEKRMRSVWFSLVASEDQEGDAPLPQISASYLRIKNGNIPVSFIQKYLVRKLDLRSDDEVEIRCMDRAIVPTWQLNHLVDLWLESTSSERVSAEIGSSAKDFVMVLAYARKVSAP